MMTGDETFDCFLSHNSKDKFAVRALAEELRSAGISVWLDEEQLRPGVPWHPLLESGIHASRSVAVLVGKDGLGPWEPKEKEARPRPPPSTNRESAGNESTPLPERNASTKAPGGGAEPVKKHRARPSPQTSAGSQFGPSPFSDSMKDGGHAPEMIALPAGCLLMGSRDGEAGRDSEEGPQHWVCVAAFAMVLDPGIPARMTGSMAASK